MNAMAPCPPDSPLMQAWERHQATDEYKNSHSWATRYIPDDDPAELERIRESGLNPWTKEMKIKAAEGSLWATFVQGWLEAGEEIARLQALIETYQHIEAERVKKATAP